MICLGCAAALGGGPSSAADATVQWHNVTKDSPPVTFALNPANPTTTNVIGFVAPTGGKTYVNSCFASVACGDPALTVGTTNRAITVSFSAPLTNVACPEVVFPVSGVEGRCGPLRAGTWVFTVLQNSYPSRVTEVPLPLFIKALTNSFTFQLGWPVSGEPFALEFNDSLSSANWQAVTNSPATLSNRNTVQIDGGAGCRFFRLRRLPP